MLLIPRSRPLLGTVLLFVLALSLAGLAINATRAERPATFEERWCAECWGLQK
jgi:chaperone required for assembly of F1-ATPase